MLTRETFGELQRRGVGAGGRAGERLGAEAHLADHGAELQHVGQPFRPVPRRAGEAGAEPLPAGSALPEEAGRPEQERVRRRPSRAGLVAVAHRRDHRIHRRGLRAPQHAPDLGNGVEGGPRLRRRVHAADRGRARQRQQRGEHLVARGPVHALGPRVRGGDQRGGAVARARRQRGVQDGEDVVRHGGEQPLQRRRPARVQRRHARALLWVRRRRWRGRVKAELRPRAAG